jgi:1,4-dihydroxy-2-naphthoate octaprenyltransferase
MKITAQARWQLLAMALGVALILGCLAAYWITQNHWFLLAAFLWILLGLEVSVTLVELLFDFKQAWRAITGSDRSGME